MDTPMTFNQYKAYMKFVTRWNDCTHLVDVDLTNGLDDGVAVPDFVVPFLQTAREEAIINNP